MARFVFHGTATTYAMLMASMAAGAIAGAIATAIRGKVAPRVLGLAALGFGVANLLAAAAPTLWLELMILPVAGFASVTFAAGVNSTLQLAAAPQMRGRVMSLYAIVFLGSTPIGAPIAGWLAGAAGARSALVLAGVAALAGSVAIAIGFSDRGVSGPERRPSRDARPSAPSPAPVPSAR
jgi:MFS family permease